MSNDDPMWYASRQSKVELKMADVHPTLQALLDEVAQLPMRLIDLPVEIAREIVTERSFVPEESQEAVKEVTVRELEGPHGPLPVRIIVPDAKEPLPVYVHFHGGGWAFGSTEIAAPLSRKIAKRTPCIVVSVDYSLSPEVKYPVAIEECYFATTWAAEHAHEFGGDPSRLAVGGESAGALLAAVVSLMARDRKGPPIALQLLHYPVTTADMEIAAEGNAFLNKEDMLWFWDQYLLADTDATDPHISPLNADLKGMPPAFVGVAEHDLLRPQGEAYIAALDKAGVNAVGRVYEGMIHNFMGFPQEFSEKDQAIDESVEHLRHALYD